MSGTVHKDFTDNELHAPGYITSTDPETTYGTGTALPNPGVLAGQLWIEEASADTPSALKYRNAANDGWVLISLTIPSVTTGDILYADGADSLATLAIGSQHDVLVVDGSSAPEWKTGLDDNNLDLTMAPAWTGTHDFSGGGLIFPTATAPTPTTEGAVSWDTDDDVLRIGDGSGTKTLVDEGRTLTAGTGLTGGGDLSANRTFNVSGLTDSEIAAGAEIAVSKLADGTARQLLQTDAAGTGVEWASNIDIPGTLDVTGAVTLDSTLAVASKAVFAVTSFHATLADAVQVRTTSPAIWIEETDNVDNNYRILVNAGILRIEQRDDDASFVGNAFRLDGLDAEIGGALENVGAATLDTGANGSSFGGELTLDGGVLALAETTTPGATAGEGRIYTKTDNKLYFQDGAGTEHEVAFV